VWRSGPFRDVMLSGRRDGGGREERRQRGRDLPIVPHREKNQKKEEGKEEKREGNRQKTQGGGTSAFVEREKPRPTRTLTGIVHYFNKSPTNWKTTTNHRRRPWGIFRKNPRNNCSMDKKTSLTSA